MATILLFSPGSLPEDLLAELRRVYTLLEASQVDEALRLLEARSPDLVLLNLIEEPEGRSLLIKIKERKEGKAIPILGLVEEEGLSDPSLTLGLDDFLLAPLRPAEALARVRLALTRSSTLEDRDLVHCGDLVIDQSRYKVSVAGRSIDLTFMEYKLLLFLATHRGRVFTRDSLLNQVWGYDYYGGDRTVDVHIRRLRSKVEDARHTFIETVRNVGYRFKD